MNSYQNLENGVMPIRSTPHSRDSPGSVRQYNRRASRRNLEEELEDTKKTIELQRKEIARLKGELKEEKRTVQHLQVRLSQQQLRMRSNNLGNFVCNVSACGLTFERDDRVREHIRKSEDAEHQRRALYLRERQCPSCGKPCRFYFRHIFTCNKELYRADLADFYGVDLAGEVVSPKEIFSAEFVRRIQSREANASGESGATQIQDIQIDHCVDSPFPSGPNEQITPVIHLRDVETNPDISQDPTIYYPVPWYPVWPGSSYLSEQMDPFVPP